jgi:hypothetical protein
MASAGEMNQPRREQPAGRQRPRDIQLTPADRQILLGYVADTYRLQSSANRLLDAIGFPSAERPAFQVSLDFWNEIFFQMQRGAMLTPFRLLLEAIHRTYGYHDTVVDLAERYGVADPEPEPDPAPDAPAAEPVANEPQTCHVIIRAENEDERVAAHRVLTELDQDPQEIWSTQHAVSYRLSATDPHALRPLLDRTSLGWTVVAPGRPDYLLHTLYVEGPDGRQWRFTDAPAAQTVGNVAAEVVDQYGSAMDTSRPTVIDHVGPGGQGRRLNPESTLDEEGVRDGDRMRVGFEATAGAVNPLVREDALFRARNQIMDFAESTPGFEVAVNSVALPTEYELRFEQPSFGPPDRAGGAPVPVSRHVVLVQLGPDFPEVHPYAFWETPIFHPNVFPNYDSEQARTHKESRGQVCLGAIMESYQPAFDFGELCRLLIDIAAYRSYSIVAEDQVNFFDPQAAQWVREPGTQRRIEEMGGAPEQRGPVSRTAYRNVIDSMTDSMTGSETDAAETGAS